MPHTTLPSLTPREAVADALHRCLLAIDSNDRELFESACLKDESMSVVAGPMAVNGWTAISDFFERLFKLVTTHTTSNVRVHLEDGANTAFINAHAIRSESTRLNSSHSGESRMPSSA